MTEEETTTNNTEVAAVATVDQTRSRKDRPTGSIHFGDADFDTELVGEATWGEVCRTCCVRSPKDWGWALLGVLCVLFFLYFFIFALELLGNSAKVMTGCRAGALFGDDTNPIAGLMVGILCTVLLQSSSTTTSIVVSLVGSVVTVNQGIYMIMGANIGTSVTNTIVAMGQMGDGDQLERAFAGATVHDMFNFLSVAILLPIEVITGYLAAMTGAMVAGANPEKGDKWNGPVKALVSPLANLIIIPNKSLIKKIAAGEGNCELDGGFYPINCTDGVASYDTCTKVGLISCDKKTNACPAFFQQDATDVDDKVSGGVCFFISIVILFVCLLGLVSCLQKMLLGVSTRIIYKATAVNGYVAMLIGALITIVVQSSSITTSALTPIVGLGVIRLEEMYPLTLGANIGTTFTAIMAAMVASGTGPLQVALAHLFFNITGIIIFYPVPYMRRIPIEMARKLGKITRIWRGFPLVYIVVAFFVVPLLFLGLSALFETQLIGFVVLGSVLVAFVGLVLIWTIYWCHWRGGREHCANKMKRCERRRVVLRELPDDMALIQKQMAALMEHTGLDIEDLESGDEESGKSDPEEVNVDDIEEKELNQSKVVA